MKMLVVVEETKVYEVEVDAPDIPQAVRAVTTNWESFYRARATSERGHRGSRVVKAEPKLR